jgi:hypothetical protein
VPVLDGAFLADVDRETAEKLFTPTTGSPQIPMLDRRAEILQSVGEQLCAEYDGQFHNAVGTDTLRLFDDGDGVVERLVDEFPSFDDSHTIETDDGETTVQLHKRAQLAPAMLWGRFHGSDQFDIEDPEAFTVFADYNLPNVLRGLDVLEYDDALADRIDAGEPIEAGAREEVELRVATVAAADQIMTAVNDRRDGDPVFGPQMDPKLFFMRDEIDSDVHRTRTTDY